MTDHPQSESPIAQLFSQSVVQGSVRYWAAHFAGDRQTAVQAALCFAHAMDMLTVANAEVIAEKSVWWHEELTDCTPQSARHPVTKSLLSNVAELNSGRSESNALDNQPIVDALHRHLHGALMSQQQVQIDSADTWSQYCELRFGSLHDLLALASGAPVSQALELGRWASRLHGLGVTRATEHYADTRVLHPPQELQDKDTVWRHAELDQLASCQPVTPPANQILIHHELSWWKKPALQASPLFTGLSTGLRGMLSSWRAARNAQSF